MHMTLHLGKSQHLPRKMLSLRHVNEVASHQLTNQHKFSISHAERKTEKLP
jgi:hypothetical protein